MARERYTARDYHGVVFLLQGAEQGGGIFADGLNLLGLALAMIDRKADALAALDRALDKNPRYLEALLNRAVLRNETGDAAGAQADMRQAAEVGAPDDSGFPAMVANKLANSHAALGDEYREAGALDEAIAQYQQALRLRPAFSDIRLTLARTLLDRGEHAAATVELDAVLASRPNWLDAMLLRGLVAYLQGQLGTAGQVWDGAAERYPDEPRLEIYRSMLARRLAGRG